MMWLVKIVAAFLVISQAESACPQEVITECSGHIISTGKRCDILEKTSTCLTGKECNDFNDVSSVLKSIAECAGGEAKANCKVEKAEIKACTNDLFNEIGKAVDEATGKEGEERKAIFKKRCGKIEEFNKCWDEKSECTKEYLENQKKLSDGLMKAADVTCSGTRTYISLSLLLFGFLIHVSKSLQY